MDLEDQLDSRNTIMVSLFGAYCRDSDKMSAWLAFLKSAIFLSLLRVPSGKNSTEAPLDSRSLHSLRHFSWLRLSMRFSLTCPATDAGLLVHDLGGEGLAAQPSVDVLHTLSVS